MKLTPEIEGIFKAGHAAFYATLHPTQPKIDNPYDELTPTLRDVWQDGFEMGTIENAEQMTTI